MRVSIFFLLFLILAACSSKVNPGKESGYVEDISLYRPIYPDPLEDSILFETEEFAVDYPKVPEESSITAGLDSLLDSIAAYTRSRGYYTIYTIQVYNGTSSKEANDAKAAIYSNFEELIPKLEYLQPVFKVKVGLFNEKLEARRELEKIRRIFPGAIIIPERIYPNR